MPLIATDVSVTEEVRLIVLTTGKLSARTAGSFLASLHFAYKSLCAVESLGTMVQYFGFKGTDQLRGGFDILRLALNVELMIGHIQVHSPGDWSFIGALNPLEVIRNAIKDYRESKKDERYRNALEAEKMSLENMALRTTLVEKTIAILKNAGASEDDLKQFIGFAIVEPLRKLQKQSDITSEVYIENE